MKNDSIFDLNKYLKDYVFEEEEMSIL